MFPWQSREDDARCVCLLPLLRFGPLALSVVGACVALLLAAIAPAVASLAAAPQPSAAPTTTQVARVNDIPMDGPSDPAELASFLDGVLGQQLGAYHIPGATVSVVKDGKVIFAKGYGSADVATGTPVRADATLFRVGSVSKLFTWTAVMQLKEQGKLDLNADVNRYLKTYQIPDTYPGKPITLAALLTHTAGFEDRGANIFARNASDLRPLGAWLPANVPARVRPPGLVTSYSNYGAALAGYVVEQVSGQPFDAYVENHILKPLNMGHSTFRQPLPQDAAADMAQGYSFGGGRYTIQPFEYVQPEPAGSFSATATDMANFMIAHLQNGAFGDARILQDATAREMHTQHFTNDPGANRVAGVDYGFYEQRIDGQRIIEHGGDTVWFHTLLALLPEHNVGLFVSYNSQGGTTARDGLLRAFLDRYYNSATAIQAPAKPLPGYTDRAAKIAGTYWPTRRSYTTFEKVLMLFSSAAVSPTGNGHLAIALGPLGSSIDGVEVAPWVFRLAPGQDVGMELGDVVFQTDSSGNVTQMLLGNVPTEAFGRVAWYETSGVSLLVIVVALLLLLAALVIWPIRFFLRPDVRRELEERLLARLSALSARAAGQAAPRKATDAAHGEQMGDDSAEERPATTLGGAAPAGSVAHVSIAGRRVRADHVGRLAHILAGAVGALFVLFTLGLLLSNPGDIIYGVTPALVFALTLGLIGVILTVGVVICAVVVWREHIWTLAGRIFYTLVTLAAVAFVAELALWNLLGYRF
jgi:CubicO group peptidase (beta-lactamase class C family)